MLAATGWDPATAARRPARPASAGSRWPRSSGWPRTSRPSGPEASLRDLVAELDERAAAQHAPTVEGVTLASLHAAKGLEWDAVFLVGLVEGMLPIIYAETAEQVEEERRLLYVGVTRAREHLSLSWALARPPGARAPGSPPGSSTGCGPGDEAGAAHRRVPAGARAKGRGARPDRPELPGLRAAR